MYNFFGYFINFNLAQHPNPPMLLPAINILGIQKIKKKDTEMFF